MRNSAIIASLILVSTLLTGCFKDLDTEPLNPDLITSENVFDDPAAYKEILAKLYGALTLTGQRGEYGLPEISAPDEGTTSFMRLYWTMQEVPTDECVSAWNDAGINEFNGQNWSANNGYVQLMYQRLFINIAYCNEYIRQVEDRVNDLDSGLKSDVTRYLAEARFLRAYYYYVAMDFYGNVPFVTEKDETGAFLPEQISRAALFKYIESELLDILPSLAESGANEYARADKAADWMLLSRLYLNAQVYVQGGPERFTDCITYCNKVINSGVYSLEAKYQNLFLADNHILRNEIILPIAEDGNATRNYGGTTFIVHAEVGGSMNAGTDYGIGSGGWAGMRFPDTFPGFFNDLSGETDSRALFYTADQDLEVEDRFVFTQGYLCRKWKNITSTGVIGQNSTFVDTDFPLFRLPEVYLTYVEAVLRGGGGGDISTATNYINLLRERAYGDESADIQAGALDLQFVLDERARELYWEAQRRTDLIRYGLFTGNAYTWNWKGNVKSGAGTPTRARLFPIPSSDLAVNTNLVQNSGY